MKRNLSSLISLFLIITACTFAQDSTAEFNNAGYFKITMITTSDGAGLDSLDVTLGSYFGKYNYYNITATSTVADTLTLEVISGDGTTWARQGLKYLLDNTVVESIIAGTTPTVYQLLDSQPKKIRLVATDADSINTVVIIEGKYLR